MKSSKNLRCKKCEGTILIVGEHFPLYWCNDCLEYKKATDLKEKSGKEYKQYREVKNV